MAADLLGCYKPKRGFASSLCTDSEACTQQLGIYRIVLKNKKAALGQRRLVVSGSFRGEIVEQPNECGGATLNHVFKDKDGKGAITTSGDVGCPAGEGDGVKWIKITETLNIAQGSGIYFDIQPGGKISMTGIIGLQTGLSTFHVTPKKGDKVCFD